ncbi:MAG: hypothetical protein ACEQSD_11965 [Flavobacteriales bacterium]
MPYSTFVGLIKAYTRAQRTEYRHLFLVMRQAQHADKKGAEKLMKDLSDE